MPYGEPFVNERTSSYEERFTFTGKERDSETGFSYFGARYYDSDLMTAWLSVDPMADKYPNISPYAYCAWNPVRLVDPDGEDWYQSDDGTAICWRKGNDIEFQKEGQKFLNIGSNYAYSVGNMTIHYNQNNAEYIYFSTSTNFISQSRGDNCKDAAYSMAQSSGANPTRAGEIYMVNHNLDGVATSTTNNVKKGISILNNNIENGLAVVVGIDYKAKQQHNLDKSQIKARGAKQNYIGDGMTDHFITIVGSMYNCNTGVASYYFYDPGSRENGSNLSNVINISSGYLQGVTAFKPNHEFKLTTIRPNINTP
jgi:RHS repeat-associated protein